LSVVLVRRALALYLSPSLSHTPLCLQQLQQSLVTAIGQQGLGDAERKAATVLAVATHLLGYVAVVVAEENVVDIVRDTVMVWCAEIESAIVAQPLLLVEIDFVLGRAARDLMERRDVAPDESDDAIVVAWLTAARRYFSKGSHPLPHIGVIANKVAIHMHGS
jgi:hypothetical protein